MRRKPRETVLRQALNLSLRRHDDTGLTIIKMFDCRSIGRSPEAATAAVAVWMRATMMNSAVGVVRRCLGAAHSAIRNGRTAAGLIGALILLGSLAPDAASAGETRRAFLVGIQRYSDGYIQRLERAANDAKDLAKDLEEVGFDKKNIKVVTDLSSKDSFEKDFSTFLNTIEAGDDVVFYFSGHGFGVEADQTNYLLFGDLKSPYALPNRDCPTRSAGTRTWCGSRSPSTSTNIRRARFPTAFPPTKSSAASPRRIPKPSS
jgi:uncharacterized protein (UPF0335 family)